MTPRLASSSSTVTLSPNNRGVSVILDSLSGSVSVLRMIYASSSNLMIVATDLSGALVLC